VREGVVDLLIEMPRLLESTVGPGKWIALQVLRKQAPHPNYTEVIRNRNDFLTLA
jgi:hypothetical protein